MKKIRLGWIASLTLTGVGILLRLNARAIAWPDSYGYSGSRADTLWGRQEDAIAQVGLGVMGIGGLVLVATYVHWLYANDPTKAEKDKPPA